jgi:hypothetical protein
MGGHERVGEEVRKSRKSVTLGVVVVEAGIASFRRVEKVLKMVVVRGVYNPAILIRRSAFP